jgi:hypothetical protein
MHKLLCVEESMRSCVSERDIVIQVLDMFWAGACGTFWDAPGLGSRPLDCGLRDVQYSHVQQMAL